MSTPDIKLPVHGHSAAPKRPRLCRVGHSETGSLSPLLSLVIWTGENSGRASVGRSVGGNERKRRPAAARDRLKGRKPGGADHGVTEPRSGGVGGRRGAAHRPQPLPRPRQAGTPPLMTTLASLSVGDRRTDWDHHRRRASRSVIFARTTRSVFSERRPYSRVSSRQSMYCQVFNYKAFCMKPCIVYVILANK